MRVTEIGVRIDLTADGTLIIMPEKTITIDELEDIARAWLANDPDPFVSAPAFVHERRFQSMRDGTSVPLLVKVHPDPRVQEVLHQLREAPMQKAFNELAEAAGDRPLHVTNVRGSPPDFWTTPAR
jgi:hypothetical protein